MLNSVFHFSVWMEVVCPCFVKSQMEKGTPQAERVILVLFPSPSHVTWLVKWCCWEIVLMNINLRQDRLWTNRLGRGKVPEMLIAVWRAHPAGSSLLLTSQGRERASRAFVSDLHSPKLTPRMKIPSERQVLFPWPWGTRAAEELGGCSSAAPQANALLG